MQYGTLQVSGIQSVGYLPSYWHQDTELQVLVLRPAQTEQAAVIGLQAWPDKHADQQPVYKCLTLLFPRACSSSVYFAPSFSQLLVFPLNTT